MINRFVKEIFNKNFWIKNKIRIVVVTIGGILTALLIMLLIGRQQDIGAQEAGEQIARLAQNIRGRYRTRPDFWGLSTQEVISKKIYPLSMTVSGEELKGYFGNPVEIGADASGQAVMPTMRSFVISYNDLNKAQCLALATNKFNQDFWLGVSGMSIVNGNETRLFDWSSKENSLPAEKQIVKKCCKAKDNSVIFHFEQ